MTRILSVDIGTRNLGVCDMVTDGRRALRLARWEVMTSTAAGDDGSLQGAIASAVAAMEAVCAPDGAGAFDAIVLENQPCMKNPRMKAVQTAIHAFFVMRLGPAAPVVLAAASGKNKVAARLLDAGGSSVGAGVAPETAGARYRLAKKRSVEAADLYLRQQGWEAERDRLRGHPKKDDLCDALLQALYHLTGRGRADRLAVALRPAEV